MKPSCFIPKALSLYLFEKVFFVTIILDQNINIESNISHYIKVQ